MKHGNNFIADLRKQANEEFERVTASARAVLQERMRAIETIAAMNGAEKKISGLSDGTVSQITENSQKWPGFRAAVWEGIKENSIRFTVKDIEKYIGETYPGRKISHIATEVWRLKQDKKIIVKKKGMGRRAGIYRMAEETPEAQQEEVAQ